MKAMTKRVRIWQLYRELPGLRHRDDICMTVYQDAEREEGKIYGIWLLSSVPEL